MLSSWLFEVCNEHHIEKKMKSGKLRVLRMLLYLLVLCLFVASVFHYNLVLGNKNFTTDKYFEDPRGLQGTKKTFVGPYAGPSREGFLMVYNKENIPIHYKGEFTPPRYGEIVVYGAVNEEGEIEALGVHNYNYNYVLYILSFITGIFVLVVFFSEWKIALGRSRGPRRGSRKFFKLFIPRGNTREGKNA